MAVSRMTVGFLLIASVFGQSDTKCETSLIQGSVRGDLMVADVKRKHKHGDNDKHGMMDGKGGKDGEEKKKEKKDRKKNERKAGKGHRTHNDAFSESQIVESVAGLRSEVDEAIEEFKVFKETGFRGLKPAEAQENFKFGDVFGIFTGGESYTMWPCKFGATKEGECLKEATLLEANGATTATFTWILQQNLGGRRLIPHWQDVLLLEETAQSGSASGMEDRYGKIPRTEVLSLAKKMIRKDKSALLLQQDEESALSTKIDMFLMMN